jgi:hypothetical protein
LPPRGPVAKHIVSRVYQARRRDPSLTFKQAAQELGISQSSLSKLRAGTRTGLGKGPKGIQARVMAPPHKASGQPQSVRNSFIVRFESADGSRTASRNVNMTGAQTKADALLMRHDPRIKRAIQHKLAKEEQQEARKTLGSPAWRRRERQGLRVVGVERVVYQSRPSFLLQYLPER